MSAESLGGGIIRVARNRENPYKTINTTFAQDARLTWGARGLMVYLLSKPDDWSVKTYDLIRQSPAGRDAVLRILKELEIFGYLKRRRENTAGGKFVWTSYVYEIPQDDEQESSAPQPEPSPEKPYMVEPYTEKPDTVKPSTVEPDTEKPDIYLKEKVQNVDPPIQRPTYDRPTPPLARPAVGGGGQSRRGTARASPAPRLQLTPDQQAETAALLKRLGIGAPHGTPRS